ncbi:FlgD immunoglobulin-like domain containing protein [Streptomyces sp. NPDC013953]|uniref:FlgD immunoglobulin-like domain containing protein n=1 Tax=Streptomyces sp. NPDC013953 TaxID=3364868 RepID=UPI0036FFF802
MRGNARARAALILALATVTAAGSAVTALPATAAEASDVTVLPPAPRFAPRGTSILNAGETGYLLAQEGDDRLLWIDYATGSATPLTTRLPEKPRFDIDSGSWDRWQRLPIADGAHYGQGSDTVALHSASPAPHVTLQKGAGAPFADIVLPEGQAYVGTFGDSVLTRTGAADAPTGYHLLRHEAGKVTDTPVTGLPEGAVLQGVEDGDARSLILRHTVSAEATNPSWSLVDLADGVAKPLPDRPDPENAWEVNGFRLGGESILRLRTGRGMVDVLDRAAPHAVVRTVGNNPIGDGEYAMVGTSVLGLSTQNPGDNEYRGETLFRLLDEEGDSQAVLELARGMATAPDGSVLVAGATNPPAQGDIDWAIHRVVPKADGGVEVRRLTTIEPAPAHIYGLSLGSGVLTTADSSTIYQPSTYLGAYRSTWLSTSGQPQPVRSTVDWMVSGRDGNCVGDEGYDDERCVSMFASGDGYHGRANATGSGVTLLFKNGELAWGPRLTTGMNSPVLADLSGRFGVIANGTGGTHYAVEFKAPDSGTRLPVSGGASAVWGSTLWSAAPDSGRITAKSLPAGTAGESFTTPNNCVPSELQAAGRWVYWACVDTVGWVKGSGVYDRQTKRTVTAPGRNVLLGDGYLVHQDPDKNTGLTLFDLHNGLPASGAVADLPQRTLVSAADLGSSTQRRTGWTVDRFGGRVAYAGDDERVRIVPTGVPAPAVTVIDTSVTGTALDLARTGQRWSGSWWISKPTGAWQITVKEAATGTVVRTISGAEGRGRIDAAWDGKNTAGEAVRNGSYTWTLTAKAADGLGADLAVTGTVTVTGSTPAPAPVRPAFRDYDGDKAGELFALTTSGTLSANEYAGTARTYTAASGWSAAQHVVPFGDLNGDQCNDVLVRTTAGELFRYDGDCKGVVKSTGPRAALGTGWGAYDVLVSAGDQTGDGRPDLIGRRASNGDMYLFEGTADGKLAAGRVIHTNWSGYRRIVGAGDLTGDGIGDLLLLDGANTLYRVDGRTTGPFRSRVLLFQNWGAGRNAIVGVGDMTGDGRPDLISRDTAGNLLRNAGNASGSLSSTVKVGTGYQGYKGLF